MFIPPVERARVKRQLRPTTTTTPAQNPIESFFSNIFQPGSPTTSTRVGTPTPTTTRLQPSETAPTTTRTVNPSTSTSSSSTGSLTTSSTSSQRTASSTSSLPLVPPADSTDSTSPSTTIVTQTASSTSPSVSGTTDASNSNQTANGNMSPLVKGIVISASVIFGLIFLALVIRKLFQFRRRNKRVSWAENISPFEPTAQGTVYEKPLPQDPAPIPAQPPSTRYGLQDVGYTPGPIVGAGRPNFGTNPDQRNSRYSTAGTGYQNYQNYPAQPQTPYGPATPYAYNPAGMGAGAAAAVGGPSGGYNNTSGSPPMPNPFVVSPVDTVGPVPISVPVAPPAAGQQILVVKRTFTPNLEDELSIVTGESVMIVAVYDDGWCKVRKLGTGGEEGVVPYECLDNPDQAKLGTAENGR